MPLRPRAVRRRVSASYCAGHTGRRR